MDFNECFMEGFILLCAQNKNKNRFLNIFKYLDLKLTLIKMNVSNVHILWEALTII